MTQRILNIALFGASGMIGSRIAAEAVRRGHRVTALSRRPGTSAGNLTAKTADLFDAASVAAALVGQDVVASAFGSAPGHEAEIGNATRALIAATRAAGLKRLVVVGGAGSLEVAPGRQLVDTDGFPAEYKPIALAHRVALGDLRAATDLDWTFFAPAAAIAPGERTGKFRTGTSALIRDAEGDSRISAEDYAIAFVDAIEQGRFVREVATVAY